FQAFVVVVVALWIFAVWGGVAAVFFQMFCCWRLLLLLLYYKMNLSGYEVPCVLITCRSRQVKVEGDGNENVPLYYDINDNFKIQFGREKFYLVIGLRFEVENFTDYNDPELPIPFRRRVFLSCYDGEHITSYTILEIIEDDVFNRLHDEDAVSFCCLGILQLVLLGVEAKRMIPDWMLRLANDRPTNEIDKKAYSIFGYTWAFKTWTLESFRVTATNYYYRYNRYPKVAWKKKRGSLWEAWFMIFFHGNLPVARLTPDETEAVRTCGFPVGHTSMARLLLQYWYANKLANPNAVATGSIKLAKPDAGAVGQSLLATPFSSHPGDYNWQSPIPSHTGKREQRPSFYEWSPYTEQPPTTILPKQNVNKNKNNVIKANLSPLNLRNAFDDENEGGDDVVNKIEMLFIAISASIHTFRNYLRPVLMIDAAHLKGLYKGTNLVAMAMDGNNQIVLIAFGICKGKTALVVKNEFPLAFHAVCCRHLMMNLSLKTQKRKGLFWKICKAYIREEFSTSMSKLQIVQPDAYQKLCDDDLQRWSRAHCPIARYNYMTSNSVESVNAKSVIHRKEHVLKLAEMIIIPTIENARKLWDFAFLVEGSSGEGEWCLSSGFKVKKVKKNGEKGWCSVGGKHCAKHSVLKS
nr:hypothetical protein [Tanacetum cinerariifolium]